MNGTRVIQSPGLQITGCVFRSFLPGLLTYIRSWNLNLINVVPPRISGIKISAVAGPDCAGNTDVVYSWVDSVDCVSPLPQNLTSFTSLLVYNPALKEFVVVSKVRLACLSEGTLDNPQHAVSDLISDPTLMPRVFVFPIPQMPTSVS